MYFIQHCFLLSINRIIPENWMRSPQVKIHGKRILFRENIIYVSVGKNQVWKKKFLSVDRQTDKNIISAMSNGRSGRKCNSEREKRKLSENLTDYDKHMPFLPPGKPLSWSALQFVNNSNMKNIKNI